MTRLKMPLEVNTDVSLVNTKRRRKPPPPRPPKAPAATGAPKAQATPSDTSRDIGPRGGARRWAPGRAAVISCYLLASWLRLAAASSAPEFELGADWGAQARLPCLVGRSLFCGDPYLIAWYKLGPASRAWLRLDSAAATPQSGDSSADAGQPQPAKYRFAQANRSSQASCELALRPQLRPAGHAHAFDCAQLEIGQLEASDEAQYKCEVTYSESLDYSRCPTSTSSKLSVIAKPHEPEVLVNGRPSSSAGAFREGSQVKLECQSAGGKPAPRIEWLNVSRPGVGARSGTLEQIDGAPQLELLRSHWTTSSGQLGQLTSSSSLVTLTRFDLNSAFVCLLVPQLGAGTPAKLSKQAALAAFGAAVAAGSPAAAVATPTSSSSHAQARATPMIKWTRLDVQVRPLSARLLVRDLQTRELLEPAPATPTSHADQLAGGAGLAATPTYSLQLGRLYALECLVEGSRPKTQVSWFNGTSAIDIGQQELRSDQTMEPNATGSYVRYTQSEDGTFSTVASYVIKASIWFGGGERELDEMFCRLSNEAFQLDEFQLLGAHSVAPIMAAQLNVNYGPLAWIEAEQPGAGETGAHAAPWEPRAPQLRLGAREGDPLRLRCSVAASPVTQNSILQIEWLKDAKPIQPQPQPHPPQQQHLVAGNSSGARSGARVENSNHLHMAPSQAEPSAGVAVAGSLGAAPSGGSSKLFASSWLQVDQLDAQLDSGEYSCAFKLLAAPQTGSWAPQRQPEVRQPRMLSGRANKAAVVRVSQGSPSGVSISLVGQQAPAGALLTLSERELLDTGRPDTPTSPTLRCQVATGSSIVYSWTFTNLLDRSPRPVPTDGAELQLRNMLPAGTILNIDNLNSLEFVTSIVGNYTCTASNSLGSQSSSLVVRVQARPTCKLSLETSSSSDRLRCWVYANPPAGAARFLGSLGNELALPLPAATANQSQQAETRNSQATSSFGYSDYLASREAWLLSFADYELKSLQADTPTRCFARNALGQSNICELSSADRLRLAARAAPVGTRAQEGAEQVPQQPQPSPINPLNHDNNNNNQTILSMFNIIKQTGDQPTSHRFSNGHSQTWAPIEAVQGAFWGLMSPELALPGLLLLVFTVGLVGALLLGRRRKHVPPSSGLRALLSGRRMVGAPKPHNGPTGWRFSGEATTPTPVLPASMGNYYATDEAHLSSSYNSSSDYGNLVAAKRSFGAPQTLGGHPTGQGGAQIVQHLQEQQPLYFNSFATLNCRTSHLHGGQLAGAPTQPRRPSETFAGSATANRRRPPAHRPLESPPSPPTANTMTGSSSLSTSNSMSLVAVGQQQHRCDATGQRIPTTATHGHAPLAGELILATSPTSGGQHPLVDGSQTSRIQLQLNGPPKQSTAPSRSHLATYGRQMGPPNTLGGHGQPQYQHQPHQHPYQQHPNGHHRGFCHNYNQHQPSNDENIYDDVIYNQMIL